MSTSGKNIAPDVRLYRAATGGPARGCRSGKGYRLWLPDDRQESARALVSRSGGG
jgi:hypothetical protein